MALYGLGVDFVGAYTVHMTLAVQFTHGLGQTFDNNGLPAGALSDHHKTVTHHNSVEQLDAFLQEGVLALPVAFLTHFGQGLDQLGVVSFR